MIGQFVVYAKPIVASSVIYLLITLIDRQLAFAWFGAAAAGATALSTPAYLRHVADDMEGLFVRLALGTVYAVPRQRQATRLQILLQTRLCILERCRSRKRGHPWLEEPLDNSLGSLQAPVQKHRTADGLERISEYGLAAKPPGFQLAGPEPNRQRAVSGAMGGVRPRLPGLRVRQG